MPTIRKSECKKVFRFISNEIQNYTQPENLLKWCELAKERIGCDETPLGLSHVIKKRLETVEDLEGFSFIEKVRLVFLFSRPVNEEFVGELEDHECVVKLDDKRKITYFRSPDGDCVLQCERHSNQRYFKGKPDKRKMTIDSDMCEKAIKFISNGIQNYTKPECFMKWCELAKERIGCDETPLALSYVITKRLDNVEDLEGFSLMEKVRLVFLFSRPVNEEFVEELEDAECIVKLDDKRKMTYFRSPDGDCVFQQDPNSNKRNFQGKPRQKIMDSDMCEKAIKFISNGIKSYTQPESLVGWSELAKTEVGYDKSGHSFSRSIRKRLERIEELKGYSLMEKVHLAFILSRSISEKFVEELENAKCVVHLNNSRKITYFRSEDRIIVLQSEHKKRNFKGKPIHDQNKTADIDVRIPDNVQTQPPPASPQVLPDPPEVDDVEITNGGKEAAPDQENKSPDKKKEMNRDTSTKQKSNLRSEEDVDVTTESIQQEAPFNGRIDYDDMDNGEYPEFMVPNDDGPPSHHKKRQSEPSQSNPKRRKIDKPKESQIANPPEINDVETRNAEGEAAPELEQKSEGSNVLKPSVKESLNIHNQYSQARDVKIEEFLEEIEQEPEVWIPEEKPEMPPPATISLLKLAEQMETFAFNIYLDEKFQQKTLRAVRLFKTNDQKIPIQEFNLLFNGMLAG
ncbi:hypothetical protein B9Z55_027801 [Caenorhabditis nigoni]|uniref:SPK domain-containing protein n=1 Tax=Caenorhabditis nigoni TaxID=1611254 RepID=A0A2G5SEE1_9PELO|nr:hypothetical protein B9Z55_027801 [Caenorhabditis nigoni]